MSNRAQDGFPFQSPILEDVHNMGQSMLPVLQMVKAVPKQPPGPQPLQQSDLLTSTSRSKSSVQPTYCYSATKHRRTNLHTLVQAANNSWAQWLGSLGLLILQLISTKMLLSPELQGLLNVPGLGASGVGTMLGQRPELTVQCSSAQCALVFEPVASSLSPPLSHSMTS